MKMDISNSLTQPVEITNWKIEEILQNIEDNFSYELIDRLVQLEQLSGLVLAKALYLAYQNWNSQDETFEEFAYERWGKNPVIVRRYLYVWDFIETCVPGNFRDVFLHKAIRMLIPPATAMINGDVDDFTEEEWEELADAVNESEVRKVVRSAKGVSPKGGSLIAKIYEDGALVVWTDNGTKPIGYLDINSDDPDVEKICNRIIHKAGILEDDG